MRTNRHRRRGSLSAKDSHIKGGHARGRLLCTGYATRHVSNEVNVWEKIPRAAPTGLLGGIGLTSKASCYWICKITGWYGWSKCPTLSCDTELCSDEGLDAIGTLQL